MESLLQRFRPAARLAPTILALLCLIAAAPALAYIPPDMQGLPNSFDNGDYLNVVCAEGAYRWSSSRLPLRVYIVDGSAVPGYRSSFSDIMAQAFEEWCTSSQGHLSWTRATSPREADIICSWDAHAQAQGGGVEAGETRTTIQRDLRTGTTSIRSATVCILTQLFGRSFSDTEIRKTCLHEVGHALGLQGHSNVPGDIMYPALNPSQVAYLRPRDINTIDRLYAGYPKANETGTQVAQSPTRQNYGPPRNSYPGGDRFPIMNEQPDDNGPYGNVPGIRYRTLPPYVPSQRFPGPRFGGLTDADTSDYPQPIFQPRPVSWQDVAMQLALQRMRQRQGYGW